MSDHTLPSPSLLEGEDSLPSTISATTKPRKPKVLRKLHLQSSGPSHSMEVPVSGGVSLSETSQTTNGLKVSRDSMTLPDYSPQFKASKAPDMRKDRSSEPLPPGLPYASVLRW